MPMPGNVTLTKEQAEKIHRTLDHYVRAVRSARRELAAHRGAMTGPGRAEDILHRALVDAGERA